MKKKNGKAGIDLLSLLSVTGALLVMISYEVVCHMQHEKHRDQGENEVMELEENSPTLTMDDTEILDIFISAKEKAHIRNSESSKFVKTSGWRTLETIYVYYEVYDRKPELAGTEEASNLGDLYNCWAELGEPVDLTEAKKMLPSYQAKYQ